MKLNNQASINSLLIFLLILSLSLAGFFLFKVLNQKEEILALASPSPSPQEEFDTFNNETAGYKFDYPRGWSVELIEEKVILASDLGKINAVVLNNELKLGYEPKDSIVALNLEILGEKIKKSFELTEPKSFDKQYIRERYLQIEASSSGIN